MIFSFAGRWEIRTNLLPVQARPNHTSGRSLARSFKLQTSASSHNEQFEYGPTNTNPCINSGRRWSISWPNALA
ncbi:hypothetical protein Mapa_000465 [Marchantia paleacea]|nr:hypothetical protein Mapa_000465 [Marchantia paleacea]